MDEISETYRRDGVVGPLPAYPNGEAVDFRRIVATVAGEIKREGYALAGKRNRHLDLPGVAALVRAPGIMSVARRLLGDDLLLWRTQLFVAEPGQGVGWHRDVYTRLLAQTHRQISVHLALTDADEGNCVKVLPGSHEKHDAVLAGEGYSLDPGGMTVAYGAPNYWREPAAAKTWRSMVLRPGEFFVFHPDLVHGSIDRTSLAPKQPAAASPLSRLARMARPPKPRYGIAFRITTPDNEVFPPAFEETADRGDGCVLLAGEAPPANPNRLVAMPC